MKKQGWGMPGNRWHYFLDGKSLCGNIKQGGAELVDDVNLFKVGEFCLKCDKITTPIEVDLVWEALKRIISGRMSQAVINDEKLSFDIDEIMSREYSCEDLAFSAFDFCDALNCAEKDDTASLLDRYSVEIDDLIDRTREKIARVIEEA